MLPLLIAFYFNRLITALVVWPLLLADNLMVYKTQSGGAHAMQCFMDSTAAMKMNGEEMFLALYINTWLL